MAASFSKQALDVIPKTRSFVSRTQKQDSDGVTKHCLQN